MQCILRSVLLSGLWVAFIGTDLAHGEPVQSVQAVDAQKYAGRWYEQARLPNRFQASCVGDVTADYRPLADGALEVINRCRQADATINVARGKAVAADGDTTGARLKVSFLPAWLQWLPVGRGDYWVVMLDPQYRYSVVSEPSRNYLWILSRTPVLERTAYEGVLIELQRKGYPVENLVRTAQRPDVTSAAQ